MLKLGITGGVGTGKSALAGILVAQGLPLIDTDEIARRLTQPGQAILGQIVDCFGENILDEQRALRRGVLAKRVFASLEQRRQLERILHPPIRDAWLRQLADWRVAGESVGGVVIPLLYETRCESEFDAVICTACSAGSQRERLRQRRWSDAQIDARQAAQMPLKTKMERADFVIWTEGTMAATAAQLEAVLARLRVAGGAAA